MIFNLKMKAMKKIIILCLLVISCSVFSAYGIYKVKKVRKGETLNIPGRAPEELWKYITLYGKKNKPLVRIYTRIELNQYSAKICRYIKNYTKTKVRFYMVIQLKDLLFDAFKLVLAPRGTFGPICNNVYLGGNYEAINWGVAVYKYWKSKRNNRGQGLIEHW